jgi:hypothetical protein
MADVRTKPQKSVNHLLSCVKDAENCMGQHLPATEVTPTLVDSNDDQVKKQERCRTVNRLLVNAL